MTNKPIKVCILGAAFNTPNMGVSVLAAGAIRCVLHRFPEARITQLDYGREGYDFQFSHDDKPIHVRFLNIRFSKKIYLANNIAILILLALVSRLIPLRYLRYRLLSANGCMKEILEMDLALSLAGGDSFSDIYGVRRLLYVSLPQLLTLFAGKRLILLPQTIGPFQHVISKAIAEYILRNAEIVYSRDRTGEKATRALLGLTDNDSKLRFCYDLGFDVDPVRPPALDIVGLPSGRVSESFIVGFNISGLLMMGGYSQNNMFGLQFAYDKLVLRLIDLLIEKRSASLLLIPHVLGTSGESDLPASERIFEDLRSKYEGRIGLLRSKCDYSETKYLIGECDFFVGARMHACIAALSQNVPAVSIAYSDKFVGVMEAIGFADLVVDPRRMDEDEIVGMVDRIFARRASVRRALEEKIPLVKEVVRRALCDLDGPLS